MAELSPVVAKGFFEKTIVFQLTETFALTIKAPQLVGIIAGCIVFTITISVVIFLLFKSGVMERFLAEMRHSPRSASQVASSTSSASKSRTEAGTLPPQYDTRPELYEHLLEAAKALPLQPLPPTLNGRDLEIRPLQVAVDSNDLVAASNGSPIFHESAYDPIARVWGWLDLDASKLAVSEKSSHESDGSESKDVATTGVMEAAAADGKQEETPLVWPHSSPAAFAAYFSQTTPNSSHLVIIDKTVKRPVGMVSLVNNDPSNLSVRIDNLWLTPALQGDGRRIAHETLLLLLEWLFEVGYRRVSVQVDVRHVIMRRFLERCGFQSEAVLRKHRIVQRRNRDTALYAVLNSEFIDVSLKIKRHLGIDPKPALKRLSEIETPVKMGK